ncbi:ParB family protein [Salinicola peritrichatus]|uniref:ParB family protein n=1 Tax=Salinicola peritrichatus TaxID=1267424 RepID=UPI000DA2318A|nr:ParB family protein [Salinicola peritrichatus]
MSKTTVTPDEITAKLKQPGPKLNSKPTDRLPAPSMEMSMTLTLEQLRPYDRNPRTQRNPAYDDIKASIQAVGLKQKLTVTQRPGDDKFMISDGGNTRLSILNELYRETGDERYFRQDCHYIPWQGEINVLAGHLAENDNRGQLSWIERARGIFEAKRMIEEMDGRISQNKLADRLRELGYAVDKSHVSRMLYTIEHFLPTIPMTLEAGMGRPQIVKLISYRQFCEECWGRCRDFWQRHQDDPGEGQPWLDNVLHGDFAQAWHDEMSQLDHEGQTEFAWNLVEDRLKGMLHEQTGLHYNPLDMSWKNWFTVRKHGHSASEEDKADIWTTVDAELERLRNPQARHLYPPVPEKPKPSTAPPPPAGNAPVLPPLDADDSHDDDEFGFPSFDDGQTDFSTVDTTPTPDSRPAVPRAGGVDEPLEIKKMRARMAELETRNAELEEQATRAQSSQDVDGEGGGLLDVDGLMREHNPQPERSPEEQATLIDDLTLDPYNESEGHRQLRHMMAKEHGEEAIDFEAAALKSVPLQSGGPVAPITDLWSVPTWRRSPRDLRVQIGEMIKALGEWAGIEVSGANAEAPLHLNASQGLGFEVNPLSGDASVRAQRIWQLLAGLQGTFDPQMTAEISLLGELVGSHGDDMETRLPDGLLIRVWWLIRLIRVLRETSENAGENAS